MNIRDFTYPSIQKSGTISVATIMITMRRWHALRKVSKIDIHLMKEGSRYNKKNKGFCLKLILRAIRQFGLS
jgi:hypothetical protein